MMSSFQGSFAFTSFAVKSWFGLWLSGLHGQSTLLPAVTGG